MTEEVEIKAKVDDFESIRKRLRAMNAKKSGVVVQTDTVYNAPHRDFRKSRELLRVRDDDGEITLCYKKRIGPLDDVKRSLEIEAKTSGKIHHILKHIGFRKTLIGRKKRECWLLKNENIRVFLDEVEGLGTFIELESLTETGRTKTVSSLLRLLDELGISKAHVIKETYPEMLHRHALFNQMKRNKNKSGS